MLKPKKERQNKEISASQIFVENLKINNMKPNACRTPPWPTTHFLFGIVLSLVGIRGNNIWYNLLIQQEHDTKLVDLDMMSICLVKTD